MCIKGLALCKKYFNEIARDSMAMRFSHIINDIAAGMIGAGSECFGYDDELSRDHDWGPGFCVFVPDALYSSVSGEIADWYDHLPKTFDGYGPRFVTESGRVGPIHLENFFVMHTGLRTQTPTMRQWLAANTEGLSLVTNGEVFIDNSGALNAWRSALSELPEDIRKKKIASNCFLAGQSGQYNYIRSQKRCDAFASEYALMQYCSRALSLAFLLARRYAPYYKWKLRAGKELPLRFANIALGTEYILQHRDEKTQERIEALSLDIINEIKAQGLAHSGGDFLADYKDIVEKTIEDDDIRALPGLYQ